MSDGELDTMASHVPSISAYRRRQGEEIREWFRAFLILRFFNMNIEMKKCVILNNKMGKLLQEI